LTLASGAVALMCLAQETSLAQEKFKIENGSSDYDVEIQIKEPDGAVRPWSNEPARPARVSLYRKGGKSAFQVLNLSNIEIHPDTIAYNPKMNRKGCGIHAE
jgi:hypothetical protein